MAGEIKGSQIASAALAASTAGRARMAPAFFDAPTATDKFAEFSISDALKASNPRNRCVFLDDFIVGSTNTNGVDPKTWTVRQATTGGGTNGVVAAVATALGGATRFTASVTAGGQTSTAAADFNGKFLVSFRSLECELRFTVPATITNLSCFMGMTNGAYDTDMGAFGGQKGGDKDTFGVYFDNDSTHLFVWCSNGGLATAVTKTDTGVVLAGGTTYKVSLKTDNADIWYKVDVVGGAAGTWTQVVAPSYVPTVAKVGQPLITIKNFPSQIARDLDVDYISTSFLRTV